MTSPTIDLGPMLPALVTASAPLIPPGFPRG